jgi:hypothetical protein
MRFTSKINQLAIRLGQSLAALGGAGPRGSLANPLRGHDPISAAAANRLREILLVRAWLRCLPWLRKAA